MTSSDNEQTSEGNPKRLPYGLLGVGITLLGVAIYYFFFAAPLYHSHSEFMIKQQDRTGSLSALGIPFFNAQNTTSREDAQIIEEYINSADLLLGLAEELDLRSHYQSPSKDFFHRLESEASREDLLDYLSKRIRVRVTPENFVRVEVHAFSPDMADRMIGSILARSEEFVNHISRSLAETQLSFVQQELETAEQRFRTAKRAMVGFQAKYGLLDPEFSGQSSLEIIRNLEAERVRKRAELSSLRMSLQESAPQVRRLSNEIEGINQQLEVLRTDLVGDGDRSFNQVLGDYAELQTEFQFAEQAFASSYASLEEAKLETARQLKFLIVLSRSGEADEPSGPKVLPILAIWAVVLALAYGIGRLVWATIEDHKI